MSGWPTAVSFTDVCETCHGNEASDEAEVGQVVGIDGGCWVDLQTVVALAGVFKQTVHGVQHLVRQEEEPFPAHTHQGDVITHNRPILPQTLGTKQTCLPSSTQTKLIVKNFFCFVFLNVEFYIFGSVWYLSKYSEAAVSHRTKLSSSGSVHCSHTRQSSCRPYQTSDKRRKVNQVSVLMRFLRAKSINGWCLFNWVCVVPCKTSVVQSLLASEDDIQTPPQIIRLKVHDLQ